MAKIVEDVLVVKFSKIAIDNQTDNQTIASEEIKVALEQVAQELVGDSIIVEVIRA